MNKQSLVLNPRKKKPVSLRSTQYSVISKNESEKSPWFSKDDFYNFAQSQEVVVTE